jgi:hypothetical protein
MDLLASSGSLASAGAVRKVDRIWAAWMQFRVCIDGRFTAFWALLGAVTKYNNADARRMPACILALRGGGGGAGRERWGSIIVQTHHEIGVMAMATQT